MLMLMDIFRALPSVLVNLKLIVLVRYNLVDNKLSLQCVLQSILSCVPKSPIFDILMVSVLSFDCTDVHYDLCRTDKYIFPFRTGFPL